MRILKFGGTSLGNAQAFIQAATILIDSHKKEQSGVVLSAPAKVTNHLIEMINDAISGTDFHETFSNTKKIFSLLLNGLTKQQPNFPSGRVKSIIKNEFNDLEEILYGIHILKQCPEGIYASIICLGEKLSILIMEALLESYKLPTFIINPTKILSASNNYTDATVDIVKSTKKITELNISDNCIILMAGFTAGNKKGETVTLGRNGSDYSASVLAACLNASCCEIWTDVDGAYTGDPRLVSDARLLKSISYKEAMELSFFGAKVLHPKTIAPLSRAHIPCLIKNTANPNAEGTIIGDESGDSRYPVRGITCLKNIAMVNFSGPGNQGMIGMAARVFSTMSAARISVILITQASSEYSICFCIPQEQVESARDALKKEFLLEFKTGLLDPIEITKQLAIISVVGDSMRTSRGLSARLFTSLALVNINVIAIAQGSSERSISVVVNTEVADIGVKISHKMRLSSEKVKTIFIVGVGGVGTALIKQIKKQQKRLLKEQINLRICGLANSKKMILSAKGINLKTWEKDLENSDISFSAEKLIEFSKKERFLSPIVADCTAAQPVAARYPELLLAGFHIVTPNKKANTGSMAFYKTLRKNAEKSNRKFLYETNVGAGLPVIENLQNLFHAGDELIRFSGILSGSLSYIFGMLDEGMTLSEATSLAKEKGFTEPDPREDLSGTDVARKLLILAREAGYILELKDIEIESVLPSSFNAKGDITTFMKNLPKLDKEYTEKLKKAAEKGKVLRYIGGIDKGKCFVKVVTVDEDDPMFKIKNGENALAFYTHYYQPIPLILRGYGAGNEVTAAGVFADILRIPTWKWEG